MVWFRILLVILSFLFLLTLPAGCVKPVPSPTLTPTPTPEPTPILVPTSTLTIPEKILASHFGINDIKLNIGEITGLGIRWTKAHVTPSGAFIWGMIERERGKYDWRGVDKYVERVQSYDMAILAEIWPFAEWDQANWGPVGGTRPLIFEDRLGRNRRKPYDMDAYRRFVSALVERYDADGIGDMPRLKYPIKYWQAMSAPSVQEGYEAVFDGSPEDYLEILTATYQAVKEADPEAKVPHGGMAKLRPQAASFWEPIFQKGSQYFDIANTHLVCPFAGRTKAELIAMAELTVPEFKKSLSGYGIDKPIWVTEAGYHVCNDTSPEEHGQILVRSCVASFASGADKFFYNIFSSAPSDPPDIKQSALIDENGERRPAYYAYKTLISKLDKFISAEKLAEGRYKFMVEGRAIYVLWGSGKVPEEITGGVLATDIYGKETRTDSSVIKLTESPIFIEKHQQ